MRFPVVIIMIVVAGCCWSNAAARADSFDMILPGRSTAAWPTPHAAVPDGERDAVHLVYAGTSVTHVVIEDDEVTYSTIPGTEGFAGAVAIDKLPCREPAVAYWNEQSGALGFAVREGEGWIADTLIPWVDFAYNRFYGIATAAVAALDDGRWAVALSVPPLTRVWAGAPGNWKLLARFDSERRHRFIRMDDGSVFWLAGTPTANMGPMLYRVTADELTEVADLSAISENLEAGGELDWAAFPHASGSPAVVVAYRWTPPDEGEKARSEKAVQSPTAGLQWTVADGPAPVFSPLELPERFGEITDWVGASATADDRFLVTFGRNDEAGWMEFDEDGSVRTAHRVPGTIASGATTWETRFPRYAASTDGLGRPAALTRLNGALTWIVRDGDDWSERQIEVDESIVGPSIQVGGTTENPRVEIQAFGPFGILTEMEFDGRWSTVLRGAGGLNPSSRVVRDGRGRLWGWAGHLMRWQDAGFREFPLDLEFEEAPRLRVDAEGRLWVGGRATDQHGYLFARLEDDGWRVLATLWPYFFDWKGPIGYDVDAAGALHAGAYLQGAQAMVYYRRPADGPWSKETVSIFDDFDEYTFASSCVVSVNAEGTKPGLSCLIQNGMKRRWTAAGRTDAGWRRWTIAEDLNRQDFTAAIDAVGVPGGGVHAAFVHGRLTLARWDGAAWSVETPEGARGGALVTLGADEDGGMWAAFQSGYGTALLSPDGAPDVSIPYEPGRPAAPEPLDHTRVAGDIDDAGPEELWKWDECPSDNAEDADDGEGGCGC